MNIPSEEEMVEIFIKLWRENSEKRDILVREVSNYQKRIDLIPIPIYSNGRLGPAHAIEFKIKNWRQCFKQCRGNRVLMPYNWLAIWKDFAHRIKREELEEQGIGLIEVSRNSFEIVLKPKRSPFVDEFYYKKIRRKISSKKLNNFYSRGKNR